MKTKPPPERLQQCGITRAARRGKPPAVNASFLLQLIAPELKAHLKRKVANERKRRRILGPSAEEQ